MCPSILQDGTWFPEIRIFGGWSDYVASSLVDNFAEASWWRSDDFFINSGRREATFSFYYMEWKLAVVGSTSIRISACSMAVATCVGPPGAANILNSFQECWA